ncbi:LamG domain-containing protein [Allohahella sp. A8]|uniref:LamG domain-containing protein n=1 Tax=Allohahella sp. A8 TaxID=3141461 RepID=UPI003A7FBFEE
MLRGLKDSAANVGAINRTSSFEEWATGYQLTEPFRKRESFHLQPGEWVEVVAINRSTGYTGTSRVQLKSVGDAGSTGLSVTLEPIVMRPPNLKVWAERMYNVEQGLQAGESRSGQIVSAEGASLLSDQSVRVFTEWLDHDGSPLPEGLSAVDGAQYGLTGRLAKVVAPNVVATTSSSNIAAFPIAPGRQTQILQWKDTQALAEHYYIQVIGQAKNQECAQCASFDKSGADAGADAPLDTRPQYITPFLVPQYDEQKGWLAYREYRRLLKAGQEASAGGTPVDTAAPNRPLPSYAWTYRPEYQFSRFSLEIDAIKRVKITDPLTGSEEKEDILNATSPVITSSDDLIEVLYSLIGPEFGRIAPIDGGQDLVLALGEHETRVTMGEDQTLRIDNIEHLASLDPEDFLTMRLYLNQDAGNVLWEYAFEHLVLGTQLAEYDASSGETLYVSADDPRVPLEAVLVGYAGRTDKTPIKVRWKATGGATLTQEYAIDQTYGIFANEITLPPNRGAVSNVSVELLDAGGATATLPPIEVVAGEPTTIEVDQPNLIVSAAEANDTTLNILVKDKHGNPVAADTGVSFFVADSLHVVSTTGATDDAGRASLTFRGGSIAEMASIRINAGQVSTTVPVEVKPLKIEFVDAEATLFAGATESFTVRVTNHLDQPVNGVTVALGSSYGFLSQTEVTTNASGEASATITAPGSDGSGELTAQAGRSPWQVQPFEVVYPQQELRDLEVDHAMMVGDTSTAGVIDHVRYDSTAIALPFKTSATIKALGQPGDAVTVKIGDFRDPNLAPLAAYYLNELDGQLVLDETGRYPLSAQFVTQARGTPMGGGRSLRFSSVNQTIDGEVPSVLWADSAPALKRLNSIGFSIDLKPTERDSTMVSGSVVDLGNGAQTLQLQSDGTLVYRVRTDTGNYIVRSAPVGVNQWHRVAARYHNGQAELWVDGILTQMPASGVLTYSDSGRTLEVGKGFEGQLNSLKWFDWSSAPVMTFADGSTQTTVTVGPDSFTDLTLQSTGVMGAGNSLLTTMRVAIHTDQVRQYASLVSQAGFAVLAGQYADTLDPNAPPINVAGLTPTYSMLGVAQYVPQRPVQIPFISQAHAADGESNFVLGLISWILPIEDFGIVIVQLGYLVSDPEKFDGLEFSIAAVNVITIFPPAKPLKIITTPLRALLRKLNDVNPKFAKYFAGYLGKVVQRSRTGDFSLLWNSLPFLALAVELYEDEDSRKGLEFMFSTINSADDVVSWVDYLALPADGWEGEGEPPTAPAFNDAAPTTALHQLPLSWLMPQAHAGLVSKAVNRVNQIVLGRVLLGLISRVTKQEAENIPDALRVVRSQMKDISAKDFRQAVFSTDMMKSSAWMMTHGGSRALRNFVRGKTNMRYQPITVMAIVAYLGWESGCGVALEAEAKSAGTTDTSSTPLPSEQMKCNGIGLNEQVRRQVGFKLAKVFADSFDKKLSDVPSGVDAQSGHGALFHLGETAYHQLKHRYAGGLPIKALERVRWVGVFEATDQIEAATKEQASLSCPANCVTKIQRDIDIVLGVDETNSPEHWIEIKSLRSKVQKKADAKGPDRYKTMYPNKPLTRWAVNKKSDTYSNLHKQFSVDIAATNATFAWLPLKQSGLKAYSSKVPVLTMQWRLQSFEVDKPDLKIFESSPFLGKKGKKDSLLDLMAEGPSAEAGTNTSIVNATFAWPGSVQDRIKLVTVTSLFSQLATSKVSDLFNFLKPTPLEVSAEP